MNNKQSKKIGPLLAQWLRSPVKQIVSIAKGRVLSTTEFDCSDSPKFDRKKWAGKFERKNNCYNYALNHREMIVYEPGYIGYSQGKLTKDDMSILLSESFHEKPFEEVCQKIKQLAEADGLTWLGNEPRSQPGHYIIALAMAEANIIYGGRDYHWYRLDQDNSWSHKPGEYPAAKVKKSLFAANAEDITMPHELKAGRYKKFMGYYLVPNKPFKVDRNKISELHNYMVRKRRGNRAI